MSYGWQTMDTTAAAHNERHGKKCVVLTQHNILKNNRRRRAVHFVDIVVDKPAARKTYVASHHSGQGVMNMNMNMCVHTDMM